MFCWYNALLGKVWWCYVLPQNVPPPPFLFTVPGVVIHNSLICFFPNFFLFIRCVLIHIHNCWSYIVVFGRRGTLCVSFYKFINTVACSAHVDICQVLWMAVTDVSGRVSSPSCRCMFRLFHLFCYQQYCSEQTSLDMGWLLLVF